jgi:4-amino-4-deoxy-L-arabinose transferase-like glycosyltransferase
MSMRARVALTAILALAAALRLWGLGQNGFGNEYYSAGVRSMSAGWHNFLYHAFDPAGFLSVDKPPVAMWIQVAAVKLFGFHGLSLLIPQVLEGVAAVWLVWHLVQRRFGAAAGLLAALFLALTPVSVAIDRSNNTDSCLVLVLLLAAWALELATEKSSRRLLLLAMALVGLAFNVKMLAAFIVLPTLALVWVLGAPVRWGRRLTDLALGGLVLAAVSLAWVAMYDLTPPDRRPYAGTTDTNSELELIVGPYGIGRFVRQPRPSAIDATEAGPGRMEGGPGTGPAGRLAELRPGSEWSRLFVPTPAGPLRLAGGQLAAQVAWLFPLALAGLILGAPWRRPLVPAHLQLVLWCGWTLTYAVVYSAAGGTFHFYYLATLAPPLAALAGIGGARAWQMAAAGGWRAVVAPTVLLVTAAWQLHIEAGALDGYVGWQAALHRALLGATLLAAGSLGVLALSGRGARSNRLTAGALGVGVAGLLVVPTAWALSSVLVAGHGVLPSADLARVLRGDGAAGSLAWRRAETSANVARLMAFLAANRQGERYLLATSSTTLAAPIIVQTGEPVMARGGFHGLDPILTPEKLADLVAAKQVRFAMLGDLSFVSRRLGAETAQRSIAEWIRAHGRLVPSAQWRASGALGSTMQLYDLRPGGTAALAPSRRGEGAAGPQPRGRRWRAMKAFTISWARSVCGPGFATHSCSHPSKTCSSQWPPAARYAAANFSCRAGSTLSSRAPCMISRGGRVTASRRSRICCGLPSKMVSHGWK